MPKREQVSVISTDLLVANTWRKVPTMTTLLLPSTDPRGPKAVELATDAGQWIKCKTRDGRKAYGIRSSSDSDQCYLVTRTTCTCRDFFYGRGRDCKHVLAVVLWCALQEAEA